MRHATLDHNTIDSGGSGRGGALRRTLRSIVTNGDLISEDASDLMRGHGTYLDSEGNIRASVTGVVRKVNQLIQVIPTTGAYIAEVGDVVVGRIVGLDQHRWHVDVKSSLDAVLPFVSVNLPAGELRRRGGNEDERIMANYMGEGDLVSAEVYSINSDGSLTLHTRSQKYGKLGQGVLIQVPSYLICRTRTHFLTLPCGVCLILAHNGMVWVTPSMPGEDDAPMLCGGLGDAACQARSAKAAENALAAGGGAGSGGYVLDLDPVVIQRRKDISRIVACINVLANEGVPLLDTTIWRAYNASWKFQILEISTNGIQIADKCRPLAM
ncbi:hypothetical protein GJ496_008967 [Pomphorhynchus laevis]|nr:hypothetical protein GJ496_008967 [Pomphorhynchus laevis]